jgi:hypothetical protein
VAVAKPLSLRRAAILAGVSPGTLHKLASRGQGPKGNVIFRPGQPKVFEYLEEDVLDWKAQREQRTPIGGSNGTD